MRKKVLIVDDDRTNLYMLETLLKGYGFEVISAENGEDALEKALLNPPDLIISDILMPVMDGYALCRRWRADDVLKHIPFVFYTATYTGSKNEDFALSLGADRFILKPQEPDILMNILKEILEENYAVKQVATKPLEEEMEVFRQYNEILFKKLEKKMSDLEIAIQELRILEERYRLSFENVSDVIYTIDTDLNIINISPSVERVLGYKPEDFIGRPVFDLGHILTPGSFEEAVADVGLILKGGTIQATVYRFIAKDGTIKYGEVSGSPLMREGKIIGAISVARDITDRKQVEEQLLLQQNRLDLAQSAGKVGVFDWDMVTDRSTWTPQLEIIYGIEPGSVEHTSDDWVTRIHPDDLVEAESRVRQCIRDQISELEGDYRIVRPDGEVCWLSNRANIFYDASGKPVRMVGTSADITDRKRTEEELSKSEKKYRDLYDFLPIPVYEMDLEASIVSANRAIYETFRGTEEDLKKGFKTRQILSPDEIERSSKNIQRLLKGEKLGGTEYTLIRLDGSVFPAIVISSVIYDNGKPVGLRGAIIDVTERRKQEEELLRMNALLASVVENIPDMIFLKDAEELRFVRFNRAGEELLGYSRDDLLGKNDYDFFPKEQADFFIEKDREVLQGQEVFDIPEEPVQTRDKGERILHTKKVPILNTKGEPTYLLGISEDITERKRAEKELRESEGKYRGILENMDDAYYELDLSGNLVFFNDALISKTGFPREELVGMNYKQYISPETVKPVTMIFSEIYRTGQTVTLFDYEVIMKDGQVKYFESWAGLLRDSNSQPIGFRGMARDITARKEVEKQLQKTLESLRKSVRTTIQVMVSAVEARDPYTAGHQSRVAELARSIATEMGLSQDKIEAVRMAGPIHDIGKLSIPAEILSKPTKLTAIEFSLIKEHSRSGYEILKNVESPWPLAEIIYQHHERMDGSGYPRNLKGDDILMEARIMAVADVVESMASHRPYRASLGLNVAMAEIENNKGTLYDTDVADACLRLFRDKGYQLEGA